MNEINYLFPKFQLILSFFQIQSVKKEHIHNLNQKRKKPHKIAATLSREEYATKWF